MDRRYKATPLSSTMTTYVYDPANSRLLAIFDDQHFGTYYQYNAENQLVRTYMETEKGKKIVSETQYYTPLKDRN